MRKYIPHILIISFIFLLAPTAHVASYADAEENVRKNPDDADAHYQLGIYYQMSAITNQDHVKAFKAFKQAIRLDPDNTTEAKYSTEHTVKELSHYGIGITSLAIFGSTSGGAKQQYKILKKLDTELAEALDESISETKEMERQRRIYEAYEGRNY